ncbi:hypothetical protein QO002_003643 [Pararhizobium capsulatum DSM 1112]|uniref:Uncharacterized protein n=1 Tax=Pararhizobium capsulatum DSM 1112 TaxID=1121113 RepID=A0ABU0BTB7_9HYPH|nr:hypothetical protein [Pararhizobium capsulatum DSM 1112]
MLQWDALSVCAGGDARHALEEAAEISGILEAERFGCLRYLQG